MTRWFITVIVLVMLGSTTKASHIIGGEIYWECIQSGPDAGKLIFHVKIYKDCSVNTIISASGHSIQITGSWSEYPLVLVEQVDVSNEVCGYACTDEVPSQSIEMYHFATAPVLMTEVPPATGMNIIYHRCCLTDVDNIANANVQEFTLVATMYPNDNQSTNPCYDTGPAFAEVPEFTYCSGYSMRYNPMAFDVDGDSLSFSLSHILGASQNPVTYESGYSAEQPLPGPTIDPSYSLLELDAANGQLTYDFPPTVQGNWMVQERVDSWRCGQRIGSITRNWVVSAGACNAPNEAPTVSSPSWLAPVANSGFEVTVHAGDTVSFALNAVEPDGQQLSFVGWGTQFGDSLLSGTSGCVVEPCATLSGPFASAAGDSLDMTFHWVTSCDHVVRLNGCGSPVSTYPFYFKFKDNACPVPASTTVTVTVNLLADSVLPSPVPHCVDVMGDSVMVRWAAVEDTFSIPVFESYVIEYSSNANGPFTQIGMVSDIAQTEFVHRSTDPIPPNPSGRGHYRIKTRSGCGGQFVQLAFRQVTSIYLDMTMDGPWHELSWNHLATPALASSDGSPNETFRLYREYPAGVWEEIYYGMPTSFMDSVGVVDEVVSYRVELSDDLPCVSHSNIVSGVWNGISSTVSPVDFKVIPNPNTGEWFAIEWNETVEGRVFIYDVSGRSVYQASFLPTNRLTINAPLTSGVYTVSIATDRGESNHKMMIY